MTYLGFEAKTASKSSMSYVGFEPTAPATAGRSLHSVPLQPQLSALPATDLAYPAITVCRLGSYSPDEYVRAVFNNFQVTCHDEESCNETLKLRDAFPHYLQVTVNIKQGKMSHSLGSLWCIKKNGILLVGLQQPVEANFLLS